MPGPDTTKILANIPSSIGAMTQGSMPNTATWERALCEYKYKVLFNRFGNLPDQPPDLYPGNKEQTKDFEKRFRDRAPYHLDAWAEVVFWKLYSRNPGIAEKQAQKILANKCVSAEDLWTSCEAYTQNPTRDTFSTFRKKLFSTPVVATAATFPAFMSPETFPMLDKQVTTWACWHGELHQYSSINGPDLKCVPDLASGTLRESHWPFIESWVAWCQFTAKILSQRSGCEWRARDVEMAVFTVQRSKGRLCLKPLY